ncbi:MAG: hypothetical protein IKF01_01335 [Bacilli bacterium]|nr:hypothetical protein [Bacilli bacterium]
MNILFEISDKLLIIIGLIVILLITIGVIVFKALNRKKIKPIEEDERYDIDVDDNFDSLSIDDFFNEEREIPKEELTDEQIEAKEELQRVYEMMSEDLENDNEKKDEIDEFERRQEEDAIISYQELMKRADELKLEANNYEEVYEKSADMSVEDILNSYEKDIHVNRDYSSKKFKNSEIVSPIYGVQSNKDMVRMKKRKPNVKKSDIISKAYEEDFDEEKTQNLEFLKSLREFRKNL